MAGNPVNHKVPRLNTSLSRFSSNPFDWLILKRFSDRTRMKEFKFYIYLTSNEFHNDEHMLCFKVCALSLQFWTNFTLTLGCWLRKDMRCGLCRVHAIVDEANKELCYWCCTNFWSKCWLVVIKYLRTF